MVRATLFFIAFFVMSACRADAAADLKSLLDRVQVLEGRFSQVLVDAEGHTLQESSGRFTLKRPGFFRWHSDEPFEQLVVGTPEKVWIYDPDLEQVTVRDNQAHNSPAAIISGDLASLKESYQVAKQAEKKGAMFSLEPLDGTQNYQRVELNFEKQKLQSLSFLDKLDQTTKITFSKVKENGKISDTLFEFKVPDDVDVIVDE